MVVSRIVLRVKRAQNIDKIHNDTVAVAGSRSGFGFKGKELANLVGPTQKSVHVMKNRMALAGSAIASFLVSIKRFLLSLNIKNLKKKILIERRDKQGVRNKNNKEQSYVREENNVVSPPSSVVGRLSDKFKVMEIRPVAKRFASRAKKAGGTINKRAKDIKGKANSKAFMKAIRTSVSNKEALDEGVADDYKKIPGKLPGEFFVNKESSQLEKKIPDVTDVDSDNEEKTVKPQTGKDDIIDRRKAIEITLKESTEENEEKKKISETKTPKTKPLAKFFHKEEKQETSIEKAKKALKKARYFDVEDTLIPFIVKHPRDARAYMILGRAAMGREAWDEAVEAFEQVVRINPETKNCYAELGYAVYKAGKITKAIEFLQKAHSADPQNIKIIRQLLEIAQRMDNVPMQKTLKEELEAVEN